MITSHIAGYSLVFLALGETHPGGMGVGVFWFVICLAYQILNKFLLGEVKFNSVHIFARVSILQKMSFGKEDSMFFFPLVSSNYLFIFSLS